ncbi:MAG TPA: glycoside hydrolase family 127 protein [Sphingobacterium sp.]|jgi:DUF1680 family protein|nr:glycoside hydrolase family 127 protein [Sphingobacterium sp.]
MSLKNILIYIVFVALCNNVLGQTMKGISYFDLKDVRLLPSIFKHAEQADLHYLLEMDPDRLLSPFLREAGLTPIKESYGNWENTGLDGHIGGHYISALSLMYAATGDARIKQRLDYMLTALQRCQEANGDGYIGGVPGGRAMWDEIRAGNIKAGTFSLNGKWVPLYNIHKTYAGLRDAYVLTGDERAKAMLIRMAEWAETLVKQLSDAQLQDMLRSEHGGLNEVFADVAAITQNPAYLQLARRFSHQAILEPLIQQTDKLTGLHANTQIPKILGFKRIADLAEDTVWAEASRFFWNNVVRQRSISIGGNSVSEHFNPVDDFSKMIHSIEGPETCNTYNMLRLTKMLYQTDPQTDYMDYYERGLFNHILSTQHPEHGGLVYFTQIRPGHYRVYSRPHTSMWCCVGSGMENHAKYGEMIYAYRRDELFVNLFIPSRVNWSEQQVEVIQDNNFPSEASTKLTIEPKKPTSFTLHIRKPSWLAGTPVVRINGRIAELTNDGANYLSIYRRWKRGDVVEVGLPMDIRTEQLPDGSNYYSILYGPIVLGARIDTADLSGLRADDSRMGHVAKGRQIPLKDLPILVSDPNDIPKRIRAVPSKPLHFTLTGLQQKGAAIQLELEPFYQIHDARYILYWPQATEKQVQEMQNKMAEEEKERLALAAVTIDKVVCGEQQPESDHFIQEENSNAGTFEDTRWREASGWFRYTMRKLPHADQWLYVRYLAEDSSRQTEVRVNGIAIGVLPSTGEKQPPKTIRLRLPHQVREADRIEVQINGVPPATSHKILEIRTISG